MKKANFGCGTDVLDGYMNYDLYPVSDDIIKLDLNKKLPFDDEYFDEILLFHVLEHVVDAKSVFDEVLRVLKSRGCVKVKMPIRMNSIAHNRWCHNMNYFNVYTMDLRKYNNSGGSDYVKKRCDLVYLKSNNTRSVVSWLYHVYSRCMSWMISIVKTEYEWKMKKL